MQSNIKTCRQCGVQGEEDTFTFAGSVKGKKYYRNLCKPCFHKNKREQRAETAARFNEFKKTLKCERCDNDDHRVLEFHHRNPNEKEHHVSEMMFYSWEKIQAEVKKCMPLCANCHRIVHWELKNGD